MKTSGREIDELSPNPLDVVEDVAGVRQWPFERTNEEELVVEVAGEWCDYRLFFSWRDDVQALHFACVFDMRVPYNRRVEVTALLAQMNEKMSIGHFEVWSDDGMPLYRHALLLRGAPGLSAEQLEDLVQIALAECERFYPAFQYVIRGGRSAAEAITAAVLETSGEA